MNFLILIAAGPSKGGSLPLMPAVVRGFSGHWKAFYAAALGLLYSAAKVEDSGRRCLNGHSLGPSATLCLECGEPLDVRTGTR